MAEHNRFEENQGPQQGNADKDLSSKTDVNNPQKQQQADNMEDDVRPADARDLRDGDMPMVPTTDKGDMGKKGSMHEAFKSKEGFRTMDEDENADDSLKKGDNTTQGNP